jgi:hypothetical protein
LKKWDFCSDNTPEAGPGDWLENISLQAGVFWTAYEQSPLILKRHKPLKISVRFFKAVNRQVVSVGFPDATLAFFSDISSPFIETDKLPLKHCR